MKINIVKNRTLLLLTCTLSLMQLTGCKEADSITFNEKHALYFPTRDAITMKYGIDSSYVSFFHNPGKEEMSIPFVVNLIGDILKEDKEYKLEIIDSMTTAQINEYKLPEKLIFRKGRSVDTLYVKIFKTSRLSTSDARVAFRVVENENFRPGYYNMLRVKARFDNIVSVPPWWDKMITFVYMGEFSVAKYELFINLSGKINIEGLEAWELRKICLEMKDYIIKNGITEEDGSPMEIACY